MTSRRAARLTIGGTMNWSGTETASRIFTLLGTGNTILNAALPANNGSDNRLRLDRGTPTQWHADDECVRPQYGRLHASVKARFTSTPKRPSASASATTGIFTLTEGGTIIAGLPLTTANNGSQIVNPVTLSQLVWAWWPGAIPSSSPGRFNTW